MPSISFSGSRYKVKKTHHDGRVVQIKDGYIFDGEMYPTLEEAVEALEAADYNNSLKVSVYPYPDNTLTSCITRREANDIKYFVTKRQFNFNTMEYGAVVPVTDPGAAVMVLVDRYGKRVDYINVWEWVNIYNYQAPTPKYKSWTWHYLYVMPR